MEVTDIAGPIIDPRKILQMLSLQRVIEPISVHRHCRRLPLFTRTKDLKRKILFVAGSRAVMVVPFLTEVI